MTNTVIKNPINPIDLHVGKRVRMQRLILSMSQEKLGEKLGLTFQQVQKYEKGVNRISASRLQHMSEILGVQVSFFFEGAPLHSDSNVEAAQISDEKAALIRAFDLIKLPTNKRLVLDMALQLSKAG